MRWLVLLAGATSLLALFTSLGFWATFRRIEAMEERQERISEGLSKACEDLTVVEEDIDEELSPRLDELETDVSRVLGPRSVSGKKLENLERDEDLL